MLFKGINRQKRFNKAEGGDKKCLIWTAITVKTEKRCICF